MDANYTDGEKAWRQLHKNAVSNFNKSWRQHQLYGHLPPIMKIIKVRWTRHTGHCWRSREKLISHVLLWTPTLGWAKAGRPARTYIQQLSEDMGYSPEDLPEGINDREEGERGSGISVLVAWHDDDDDDYTRTKMCVGIIYIYIYIYIYI